MFNEDNTTEQMLLHVLQENGWKYIPAEELPRDYSDILVDSMVKWDDIYTAVMSKKGELLRDVKFVDEYKGKQIPAGKKSVTLRLVIGSSEKTLTGEEIEQVAGSVLKRLTKTVGAEIRTN